MKTYFADTSYYISVLSPKDAFHGLAVELAGRKDVAVVTTTYVLMELAAYFARPPQRANLILFVDRLRQASNLTIVPCDAELFDKGWDRYSRHIDKGWSLVDCISFLIMEARGLREALATDRHFIQAGFQTLPEDLS